MKIIQNDDLSLCGKLLLEDSFRVRGAKNERIVYLFDRLLLIVRRKGEHLVYKGSIPVNKNYHAYLFIYLFI